MEFSVVVPVHNEVDCLQSLQKRLLEVMQSLSSDYEIIYVDDASSDTSLTVLKDLQAQCQALRIISFAANRGQSAALYAGFKAARGQWIITLDADGQNPPEEIIKFFDFRQSADFITGVRASRNDTWMRKAASSIAKHFRKCVLGDSTIDTGCALRMFKREIIEVMPFFKNFHRFFTFLVRTQGFVIKEVKVQHARRLAGVTNYSNMKRLREGLFDLWGVFWLKRRLIRYEVKHDT